MDTFPLGGIAKAQLALFNELHGKYEIDFLLMQQEGLFIPLIPKDINLLPEPIERVFRTPHPANVLNALRSLSFAKWLKWCTFSAVCTFGRLRGGLHGQINAMDVWLGKNTPAVKKHYDAAIAFQGGRCIYYLAEQIDAKVKIGFVHNDYSASEVDFMLKPSDIKYYPMMDHVVTISPECCESLYREFPDIKDKCCVVGNICSAKMIRSMAERGDSFSDGFGGIRLVTMGRFDINQKGIDMAVEACALLKNKGLKFKWYFLGDGRERPQVEKLIIENDVRDVFVLLGAMTNPYPYIKDADVYVQPSRFEGKSVALDEVKALAIPTVVTNFSTVHDQFTDGKTAIICEIKPTAIATAIEQLVNSPELQRTFRDNLLSEKVGNEEQALVFESLLQK